MDQPIKLSIAATSKRVDIANLVGFTFFNQVESRQPMAISSWDWRGNSLLLKNVKPTTLAMSTRLDVAAMESLIGSFICFL